MFAEVDPNPNEKNLEAGVAAYSRIELRPHAHWGVLLRGGYKSSGYLVGRRVEASPLVLGGLSYRWTP